MTDTVKPPTEKPPAPRRSRKGTPPIAAEIRKPATKAALTAPAKPAKVKAEPVAVPAAKKLPAAKPAKAPKLPSERVKPLNFRVTPEFRKAFKQAALTEDCKKVELLERIFAAWTAAKKP